MGSDGLMSGASHLLRQDVWLEHDSEPMREGPCGREGSASHLGLGVSRTPGGEYDFVFEHPGQLEDMLGMVERQQFKGSVDQSCIPFLSSCDNAAPLALQFQPSPAMLNSLPSQPQEPHPLTRSRSPFAKPNALSPLIPTLHEMDMLPLPSGAGASSPPPPEYGSLNSYGPGPGARLTPAPAGPQGPASSSGALAAAAARESQRSSSREAARKEGKAHASHSSVEKQRRDRINSLIDELRDLVPPQLGTVSELSPAAGPASASAAADADARRAKHVVLQDAINLLKALQGRVQRLEARAGEAEAALSARAGEGALKSDWAAAQLNLAPGGGLLGLGMASAEGSLGSLGSLPRASERGSEEDPEGSLRGEVPAGLGPSGLGPARAREDSREQGLGLTFEEQLVLSEGQRLAMAEERGAAGSVVVDQHPDCIYVKVTCRDRHGLLSDIVRTLKALPLEITTAAVTTTRDGNVSDMFQVTLLPGASVSLHAIRDAVQSVIEGPGVVEKKRKALC